MNMQYGTMLTPVKLLGTSLTLEAGQRVKLVEASNLPKSDMPRWFASPENGKWEDGVSRNSDDSILICHNEVEIDEEYIPHPSQNLSCFI